MAALTPSSSFGGAGLIGSSGMPLEVRKVYRRHCLGKIDRRTRKYAAIAMKTWPRDGRNEHASVIATDALGNVGSGQAVVR
ncbi:MAG: hypothetical protein Q7R30_00045 [Acidobacteriota bacterium]|nr:hypothetical protein [Acidobacteriota bacterium]